MRCPLGFKQFGGGLLVVREDTCTLSSSSIPMWAPKGPWWGVMYVRGWLLDSARQCPGDSNQTSEAESFSANKAIKCIPELGLCSFSRPKPVSFARDHIGLCSCACSFNVGSYLFTKLFILKHVCFTYALYTPQALKWSLGSGLSTAGFISWRSSWLTKCSLSLKLVEGSLVFPTRWCYPCLSRSQTGSWANWKLNPTLSNTSFLSLNEFSTKL